MYVYTYTYVYTYIHINIHTQPIFRDQTTDSGSWAQTCRPSPPTPTATGNINSPKSALQSICSRNLIASQYLRISTPPITSNTNRYRKQKFSKVSSTVNLCRKFSSGLTDFWEFLRHPSPLTPTATGNWIENFSKVSPTLNLYKNFIRELNFENFYAAYTCGTNYHWK